VTWLILGAAMLGRLMQGHDVVQCFTGSRLFMVGSICLAATRRDEGCYILKYYCYYMFNGCY